MDRIFILPAFGLSNAAATLVGQNLGAKQALRAEESVWKAAKYNAIFMAFVSLLFLICADFFVKIITTEPSVVSIAVMALRIVSLGYIFYGIGMVMMNAFNGAGDSRTPTWVNLFWFWIFQIPVAYLVAIVWNWGPKGVFICIVVTETCITMLAHVGPCWRKRPCLLHNLLLSFNLQYNNGLKMLLHFCKF